MEFIQQNIGSASSARIQVAAVSLEEVKYIYYKFMNVNFMSIFSYPNSALPFRTMSYR